MITKATAVLFVQSVEKSAPFFEAAGFTRTVEVPHEDKLGFAIFQSGNAEVMLQSYASGLADMTTRKPEEVKASLTHLFVEVDDLAKVEAALKPYPIVMPRRTTFYGATETGYREPGGHFLTFAEFAKKG
jgi:predicted lactoylglutathione lyase